MKQQRTELTDEEVKELVDPEVELAEKFSQERASDRTKAWDRYYGRKLGNERKGRSQFITRELMDTVEWMMPYLIRTFAAGDPKIEIEIKGQPPFVGKALMEQIQADMSDTPQNLVVFVYQWVKDCLVSDTSFVKLSWELDKEPVTLEFPRLSREHMQQLLSDPDATLKSAEHVQPPFGEPYFVNVVAVVQRTIKDGLYAENMPHWEFLTVKEARDMNDEQPKGHKTKVSLDYLKRINRAFTTDSKKPYFKHLDELEGAEDGKGDIETDDAGEKVNYMDTSDETLLTGGDTEQGPKTPIKFTEWYTRLDVNKDGFLENIVCFYGNDKLLRWEINKDGFVPMCAAKAIIDCYKFYGLRYGDLLIEIQNLKTMLFRRILDLFDFQATGRWRVDPNGQVDLNSLFNNAPGKAVFGKKDAIEDISPKEFNPRNLTILEYVNSMKEDRTGVTRYNQGTDASSLNKTATGIVQIQSAAMQRIELIARLIAETGLKDFYRKAVLLYQKNLKRPFVVKVHGEQRQITPEMIQGQVVCKVNMGVEAAVGAQEAQKIERMIALLFSMNDQFPGLLTPEKIHNVARRYITSMGFKQADDFVAELRMYVDTFTKTQQQQSEMQQRMIALEQQFKQMEMALKAKEIDAKKDVQMSRITQDGQLGAAEMALEERDSKREFKVDMLKAMAQMYGARKQAAAQPAQGGR